MRPTRIYPARNVNDTKTKTMGRLDNRLTNSDSNDVTGSSTLCVRGRVVYRFEPFGYYRYSRISRTTDQRRTGMGAGTLRRNGDPDNHRLHVYDTQLTADTLMMTPNVTTRDTNVTHRSTHDGYSRHGLGECLRLLFKINNEFTIRR